MQLPVETIPLVELKPHPRNYRQHPPDQLVHIQQSIREHGVYRNIVVAADNTILAGHGVALACASLGLETVNVIRLPISADSAPALKVLAGDNEISHLAEVDDRLFTEILKEISNVDSLLGTGYDEMMLANLVYVTRTEAEICDRGAAAAWADAGMPEYENGFIPFKIVISFRNEEDRQRFADLVGLTFMQRESRMWATWWPPREREDLASLQFVKP